MNDFLYFGRIPAIGIVGLAHSGKDTVCKMLKQNNMFCQSQRYGFADPLKEFVRDAFCLTNAHMYNQDLKETELNIVYTGADRLSFSKHFESALERLKTLYRNNDKEAEFRLDGHAKAYENMMLEVIKENTPCQGFMLNFNDIYVNCTPRHLLQVVGTEMFRQLINQDFWIECAPKSRIIIPDVRFQNEADFITETCKGHIIHVVDPEQSSDTIKTSEHVSENFAKHFTGNAFKIINDKSKGLEHLQKQVDVIAKVLAKNENALNES